MVLFYTGGTGPSKLLFPDINSGDCLTILIASDFRHPDCLLGRYPNSFVGQGVKDIISALLGISQSIGCVQGGFWF